MLPENNTTSTARCQDHRVGAFLLVIGFAALCFALLMYVSGSLLADYYDARHITWRMAESLEVYPLLGIPVSFIGFILLLFSGSFINRRIQVLMVLPVIVFIPLLFFIFANGRPTYPTNRCRSNQRQLALYITMYAQDHQDRLPAQLSDVFIYDEDSDILACPLSHHAFHPPLGYSLNGNLAGKSYLDLPNPESMLLTADSIHPSMRILTVRDIDPTRHVALKMVNAGGEADDVEDLSHPRGFVASFVDGSARFVDDVNAVRLK